MLTSTILESNFLSPSRFILVIDTPDFESVSYHCQTAPIPGVKISSQEVPWRQFNSNLTGSNIEFDPLDVRFIVDENMDNYVKIYEWMLTAVQTDSQPAMKKDMSLLIYNNNNNMNKRIQFIGGFPMSLSSVEFNTTNSDTQFLFADVSFSIDYYQFR